MSSTDFKTMAREMAGREGSRNSLLLAMILLLLVLVGVWAYITELDNVTRGEGRVVSQIQNQNVQAAEGGVILRRYVSEGSTVQRNDILFEIDPIDASSELNRMLQRNAALKISEKRLQAEIMDTDLSIPSELSARSPTVATSEQSLFRARRAELAGDLNILRQKLAQRQQDLIEAEASINTFESTATLLAEEIELIEPLVKQGITSETRLLELRRELTRTRGSIDSAISSKASAEAGIREIEAELIQRADAYKLTSMQELTQVVSEISELEEAIPSLEERVGRTIIRSPVTGIINRLAFRTAGGYVNRGDIMVEIVPTEEGLEVEARIKPADISNIRIDDQVRIRFSAYDSARYGTVDGRVTRISPDALQDEETGETYYLIHVDIEGNIILENGNEVNFMPGMTATVDVLSGKRTILEYIWQPVARVQELALRD